MSAILILIPAAGASSRMRGRDKLLEEVDGEPLLARQARRALASGARVFVSLSIDRPARAAALAGLKGLETEEIDGREGMAASIRAGAAQAGTAKGLMILPADMPEIGAEDIAQMIAAFGRAPERVHRATSEDGQPGHPVIFPRRLFAALGALQGDEGARALLKSDPPRLTALPGRRALTDLDTPEDWARWRAEHG